MVANFARGGAAINVLARHFGVRLTVVDMGVSGTLPELSIKEKEDSSIRLADRRVANGTADISQGPAMSREEAIRALEAGIQVFEEERAHGLHAVGTGDMGIGNTTPSSAIAATLLKRNPADLVNRGTGIDDDALKHKVEIVSRSLEVNQPDPDDPLDVLSKVGGFEIGGIAGMILAACANRTPVVVDGFISTAAALLASRFHPEVRNYLFAGHCSAVLGHELMLDALALKPMVNLGMRLGEGTGAAFGLSILAAASRVAREMLTFDEAEVSNPESVV
jgi:nicotinate-nucleotide--dimethylbenzimidazole phosphoribosyltransferase